MALKTIFFHLFTAVIAVNLIFAEEDSDRFFGFAFLGGGKNSDNNGSLPFAGFFGNSVLPSIFNFGPFGSRQARSIDNEEEENEAEDRLFFGNFVSCNYTSEGGTRCSSCRQSLACFPNNMGRVRTCRGLLRYCNNGRCSFTPGSQCSSTNSTG